MTPTLPSPIVKNQKRQWGREYIQLGGDEYFHNNFCSPSPIREVRMGEGRDGGHMLSPLM
ncbi:MAG TPA: hypothetical protein PKE62_11405 [Anaerolineales bacterium]|nr:hypothetical protein [Anaerolineales bacterium]